MVLPTSRAVSRYPAAVAPEMELQRAPSALQRYHWKRCDTVPLPAHVPGAAVSRSPCRVIPVTDGTAVTDGPSGFATTARVLRVACALVPILAVTRATSAWPRSTPVTVYVLALAPAIGAHSRPFSLQRSHT